MLERIVQIRRGGAMKFPDTPLGVAVQRHRIFNQPEGKSPRTIEVYDRILGDL